MRSFVCSLIHSFITIIIYSYAYYHRYSLKKNRQLNCLFPKIGTILNVSLYKIFS